jgi:hypothetical protein
MKPKKKSPKPGSSTSSRSLLDLKAKEVKAGKAETVKGGWSGPGDEGPEESIVRAPTKPTAS